jgi:hypothetical protein
MARSRDISKVLSSNSTLATDAEVAASYVAQSSSIFAGKNKIINGDFGIWQRGTSFTPTNNSYTADRFGVTFGGSGTLSVSQQTFTPGAAPVAGYEGQFFARMSVTTVSTISALGFFQGIEDVRTFANQTVTVSFWAKADSARTISTAFGQGFGTGGSSFISGIGSTNLSVTTSWTRVTATISIPSVSGKTIGAGSALYFYIFTGQASGLTVDIWGVQVEAGSIATPYVDAGGGSVGAELALCQRYFESNRHTSSPIFGIQAITNGLNGLNFIVRKRATPTVRVYSSVTGVVNTVNNGNGNVQTNITGVNSYIDSFQISMSGTTSQMYTYYYEAEIEL